MFHRSRIPIRAMATEGLLPGPARRALYRRKGYRVDPSASFAPGVVIEGDDVEIGAGASFGLGTVIRGRHIRIGRRVSISAFCIFEGRDIAVGDDSVIREQVFVGGPLFPDSALAIEKRVRVFQSCFLNPSRPLRIGDDTGLGGRSSVFTHGSWQPMTDGYPVAFEPVDIGRNVWLPWHVFILPGVTIGDNATIGAGSVVNRSIPGGALAAGVPAKVLRDAEEWPRRLDHAQRWRIATDIIRTFAEFLIDHAIEASFDESEHRAEVIVAFEHRRRRIVLVRGGDSAVGPDDIVIGFGADSIGRSARWWFDLDAKRKHSASLDDPITTELQDWLSRYGLRFTPEDEL